MSSLKYHDKECQFWLDISTMNFSETTLLLYQEKWSQSVIAMQELEKGSIANPDENRMVGHYWLRNSQLSPTNDIASSIETSIKDITQFSKKILDGEIGSASNRPFTHVLLAGIGGSALGPQFLYDALKERQQGLTFSFLDNTDPDGIERLFADLNLSETLVLVISKSGGTPETRNGLLETKRQFALQNIDFPQHAVAITGVNSKLDKEAISDGWVKRFPLWDWVGGRTSVTSTVGLVPAALMGINLDEFLHGAREMDELTRSPQLVQNPAGLMALAWYESGNGKGERANVVLPYRDRLLLFSRYLQQLIMESIGKSHDLEGNLVEQGLTVYGNKGSTDQHAFVQQLRDGKNDFFVTFIEALDDANAETTLIDDTFSTGDYLFGFLEGTKQALSDQKRPFMSITIPQINARTVGQLIALFERTVGYYASLIGINAYHQPGVEAGKKASATILNLQKALLKYLDNCEEGIALSDLSMALKADKNLVYRLVRRLAYNQRCDINTTGDDLDSMIIMGNKREK